MTGDEVLEGGQWAACLQSLVFAGLDPATAWAIIALAVLGMRAIPAWVARQNKPAKPEEDK